jgi:hypothetical protein
MTSGEEAVAYFEFVNDSTITWGLDETRLGTAEPMDRASAFFVDGNWLSPTRATGADHSNYAPGRPAASPSRSARPRSPSRPRSTRRSSWCKRAWAGSARW